MSNKNLIGQETGHYSNDYMLFNDGLEPKETLVADLSIAEAYACMGHVATKGIIDSESIEYEELFIRARLVA
jgi:hypothetical protein